MITDDALRQHVYRAILKMANKRLEQAFPGSSEGAFAHLSLAALLNLLFLMRGDWGSIGDYVTTQRALRATVGDDLLWADPQEPMRASARSEIAVDREEAKVLVSGFKVERANSASPTKAARMGPLACLSRTLISAEVLS